MITLNSISVDYGNTSALKDVSLNINTGEKIGLIGPSGSGKTTLLKKLYATALKNNSPEPGFIHQDFALIEQLSVFHNVYIGQLDNFNLFKNIRNFLLPSKEMKGKIHPILEQLGLEEKLFIKARELSGGQKQRLAIARCLFKNSALIFADEPVSSVDPRQAEQVFKILANAAQTLIISLHSTEMALRLCDRLIALRAGKIIFDGPASELSDTQLSELFQQ